MRVVSARGWAKKSWEFFRQYVGNDTNALVLILLLSALLRLPFLEYPNKTVFDEAIYTNYAIHGAREIPYFDIHPPLARMLFANIVKQSEFTTTGVAMETNQDYGDFPYLALRVFIVIFGILLPACVYVLSRQLHFRPEIALFPALFVVFDNAFIIYSRTILPDTLLLITSVIALSLTQAILMQKQVRSRQLLAILLGIVLGAALAIKWTALAILAIVSIWLIANKAWRVACAALVVAFVCYVIIFSAYFTQFSAGGKIDPMLAAYRTPWIDNVTYVRGDHTWDIVAALPKHHRIMMRSNSDDHISSQMIEAPHPLAWSVARAVHKFWQNEDGTKRITLTGNTLLWFGMCFLLLFELGWCLAQYSKTRKWPIQKTETLLLLGYFMSYVPFFFIGRPMYLYHYLTPLLFLFLLTPFVVPRIIRCVNALAHDRYIGSVLVIMFFFLIVLNYVLLSPLTYGF